MWAVAGACGVGGGDGTGRTWGGDARQTRAARTRENRTRRREVAEAPRDAGGMRMQRRSSSTVAVECLAWAGVAGIKERARAGVSAPRSARSANPCSGTCRLAARSRSPPQPSVRGSLPVCARFAPCVVRVFFYVGLLCTGGSPSTRNKGQAHCLRDPSQTCGCACGDRSDGHVHRHVPDAARHAQAPARTSGPLPAQRTPRHLPPPAAARLCRHQAAPRRRSSGSVRAQHALIMRPPTGAQPRNDRLLCAHDMEGNALIYMYTHVDTDVRVFSTCMHRYTCTRRSAQAAAPRRRRVPREHTPRREPTHARSLLSRSLRVPFALSDMPFALSDAVCSL